MDKERDKKFKELTNLFVDYLYEYGTPHTKIIIDMEGAEQLEGNVVTRFELRD